MPSSRAFVAARPEQLARAQLLLDGAPLLGQVAAPVGRDPGRPGRGRPRSSCAAAVSATCSAPRRERTNARVRTPSTTRSVSRSAVSEEAARRTGAPFSPAYDVSGGSHRPSVTDASRGGVLGHRVHRQPGEPPGRGRRFGHGRRGEDEGGAGPVQRAHPAQPAQHLRDVGAEDAAVVVALVDDHVAQRAPGSGASARGRAAGCGAACRGWSARTPRGRGPSRAGRDRSRRRAWSPADRPRGRAARPAGPAPGPWSGRGRASWHRAGRGDRGHPEGWSAPAAGRPATCPRRCRSRPPRAARRTPPPRPRPGAPRGAPPRVARAPRRPRGRPRRATRAGRPGRGAGAVPGGSADPPATAARPTARPRRRRCRPTGVGWRAEGGGGMRPWSQRAPTALCSGNTPTIRGATSFLLWCAPRWWSWFHMH